jgi:hypothetical protein
MPDPFTPKIGFGMKVAWQVVVERDVLDDEAAGADVIRRHQHIVIVKIDLVLAGATS